MENMFCFQCQETALNTGCKIKGVCGKDPQVACLMDTMLYGVRGMAIVNKTLREKDIACHKCFSSYA
jgi:hydroxylamine reductase